MMPDLTQLRGLTRLITRFALRKVDGGDKMGLRTTVGRMEAMVSMVINAILGAVKLTLGLMHGSLALIADAVHTLSDTATSGVVLLGFGISGKPADKEHPFGHGRVEYVATLIIAVMLGVVGFEFMKSGFEHLMNPRTLTVTPLLLITVVATIFIKWWLGRFSLDLGQFIESAALEADAWHHRSDAISSVLVLVALWGSNRYPALDAIGGLLVGAYLIYTAYSIARATIDPLLGQAPSPELVRRIRELCRSQKHVVDAHDIVVHNYEQYKFLGLHLEVSHLLSIQAAHDVAEEVEALLLAKLGAYATIHIDPIDEESQEVAQVKQLLTQAIADWPDFMAFHDLRMVNTPKHQVILFDAVLSADAGKPEQTQFRKQVSRLIALRYPGATIDIHIAPVHVTQ